MSGCNEIPLMIKVILILFYEQKLFRNNKKLGGAEHSQVN
jgi:hypothetical protein